MAQYQAYLHSNRVNWLVFHHKMSKFHHEMSKFHHKCPNSIIIPCKFRFLDEKIKLENQQVGNSQYSQSHPNWTNLHLCLVLSTPSYFLVSHFTHLERHCSLDSLDLKIPKALISACPPRPSYFLVSLACVVFWKAQSNQVIIAHSIFVTSS